MQARRSHSSLLRRVAVTAALGALLVPAGAAEAAKRPPKKPVVTKVTPMKANIGDTITVHGRNFLKGKAQNTVVFKREGARAIFVKSDVATLRQIRVVLPARLSDYLAVKDGNPSFTRFQVRVLSKRFGKAYTRLEASPMIGPELPKEAAPGTPGTPGATGSTAGPADDKDSDCDGDGIKNGVDTDDDNDLLTDEQEKAFKTEPCKRDTDADGAEDGYEYRSARDLNDNVGVQNPDDYLPYPSKRPYPNPLFADAGSDYDGDGLTLLDEYKLWNAYGGRNLSALNYSDGKQHSLNISAVAYDKQQSFITSATGQGFSQSLLLDFDANGPFDNVDNPFFTGTDSQWGGFAGIMDAERLYYDFDHNGVLSDDERDEDADGLTNWMESHGYMTRDWWDTIYAKEKPFPIAYVGTEIDDPDSDGDGIIDGADDQDHDDVPNLREFSRQLAAGELNDGAPWTAGSAGRPKWIRPFDAPDGKPLASQPLRGWVNPFNPCLPNPDSRTCPRYIPAKDPYPPFDPKGDVYYVLN
jgi:hypothetical protein